MVSLNGLGEELTATEFEIEGTRFFVGKLPAMAAFDLLEQVRHELGKSQSLAVPGGGEDTGVLSILKVVLSLDPVFVKRVRTTLFEKVSFANARAASPQPLAGAEDVAFHGLPVAAIYEVLARALAVNFTESWEYAVSKLRDASLDSSPSGPSE